VKTIKGRTAYVSGAASGMGFGISAALAQAGANIAMVDIRADALAEAQRLTEQLFSGQKAADPNIMDAAVALTAAKGDAATS